MHIGSLKKWALALTFWLALQTSTLKAQIFSNDLPLQAVTTGSNPVDFEFRADGTLIAQANYINSVTLLPATEEMQWYPSKAAFRAGSLDGNGNIHAWDLANVGQYSAAFGLDTSASGKYSTAFGRWTLASNNNSMAWGMNSTASGQYSTAGGASNTASGVASIAFGDDSIASGAQSIAMGSAKASGSDSVALGGDTLASGVGAVAFGISTTASGYASTSLGLQTTASGKFSTASGYQTSASAYNSFVIGAFNVGLSETNAAVNPNSWVSTDPLFEIGNGNYGTASNNYTPIKSDALVIYKNGNAVFSPPPGTASCSVSAPVFVTTTPGGSGDIPMYTGN